jgi:hypothetical protein
MKEMDMKSYAGFCHREGAFVLDDVLIPEMNSNLVSLVMTKKHQTL